MIDHMICLERELAQKFQVLDSIYPRVLQQNKIK